MSDRICKNCRLRIADNAKTCLFCGRVLTKESDNVLVNMYPAIFHKTRMAKRIVWSFTIRFDLNTGVTLCVELLFGCGTSLVFCDSSGFCVWNFFDALSYSME